MYIYFIKCVLILNRISLSKSSVTNFCLFFEGLLTHIYLMNFQVSSDYLSSVVCCKLHKSVKLSTYPVFTFVVSKLFPACVCFFYNGVYIQETIFLQQYFSVTLSNCDVQNIYCKQQPLSLVMSGAGVLEQAVTNTFVFCELSDQIVIKNIAIASYVLLHCSK